MDMQFSITLTSRKVPVTEAGESSCYGIIQIGEFRERFITALAFWSACDYQIQWNQALKRILGHSTQSCLITSLTDPETTNFITWWPIYRVDDILYFQNQVLFLADLADPFNPDDPYKHIPSRKTRTEEGNRISEWSLSVDEVKCFLVKSEHGLNRRVRRRK
jgi:hypothetical protein